MLVLGAGIAAYQAAIAAAREGAKVCMVGHAKGASPYIVGFNVAFATAGDPACDFYEDTWRGGYMLGNRRLVQRLAEESEPTFRELQAIGVPFEMRDGRAALRHLSGSRRPRSVYVKTGTGVAIHKALLARAQSAGIDRHLSHRVLRLVPSGHGVAGAIASDRDGVLTGFLAGSTVLALGGIGGLYGDSTYPSDVVGDSYALALDVGATLVDMEFVQFEPTVVSEPLALRGMEMPTAMLGDGAIMKNGLGERFMCRYNPEGCEKQVEKARMALCMQTEIDEERGTPSGSVWFDATALSDECLRGYVNHYRRLMAAGIDPSRQPVEVRPAAHSLMGGVEIDHECFAGLPGLFACGETAGGLHGASRIAGNGASDAIILSRVAGLSAARAAQQPDQKQFVSSAQQFCRRAAAAQNVDESATLEAIRNAMSSLVGIRRSAGGLQLACDMLERLDAQIRTEHQDSVWAPTRRVRNAVLVASSIAKSALLRQESRGAHFRVEYPEMDPAWQCTLTARLDSSGSVTVSRRTQQESQQSESQAAAA